MPAKVQVDNLSNVTMEKETLKLAYESAQKQKDTGNHLYKNGNYKEALKYYSKALQLMVKVDKREQNVHGGTISTLYNNRAAAYTMLNKHQQALEDVNFALAADPTNQKCYLRKAKIQMEMGNIDDAQTTYRAALVRDPQNPRVKSELQISCHIKEELEAIKELMLVYDDQQKSKLPDFIFKDSSLKLDNVCTAQKKIDEILQLGGCTSDVTIHMYKVQALLITQRALEADSLCTKWLRKFPHHSLVLFWYAVTLFLGSAKLTDAQTRLKSLLHRDPDNEKAKLFYKFIRSLEKQKRNVDKSYISKNYTDALQGYTELLKPIWCPHLAKFYRAKLYFNRALTYAKLEKFESTIQDCTDAIKLEVTYIKAYMLRASAYLKSQNNRENAVYDYEKAKEILSDEKYQSQIRMILDEEQQKILVSEVNEKLKETKAQPTGHAERRRSIEYYKLLDVETTATDADIRKAYRKMALKFHPDRHTKDDDKVKAQLVFREVSAAYEVLSDPSIRQRYDAGLYQTDFCFSSFSESTRNFASFNLG